MDVSFYALHMYSKFNKYGSVPVKELPITEPQT